MHYESFPPFPRQEYLWWLRGLFLPSLMKGFSELFFASLAERRGSFFCLIVLS